LILAAALALLVPRDSTRPAAVAPRFVEHCKRAAYLLYDITWAAACYRTADDSNDCTLPDEQAHRVNDLLLAEESRCLADAQSWSDP
jgi:hypothetical protein